MNREIKFRGKDIDTGEWRYGYVQYNYKKTKAQIISPLKIDKIDFPIQFFDVDPKTVGQFTGLYDKNGKEIYEGDILFCIGKRYDNKGKKYYREVKFKDGFFGMMVKEYNILSLLQFHFDSDKKILWEVIGNIYDNPELLSDNKK